MMKKIAEVIAEVLNGIKPSAEEEKRVNDLIGDMLRKLSKIKDASPVLGGSGAKGTWLSGAHDADIFVKFSYRKYHGNSFVISDILAAYLKKHFRNVIRLHGSRDYFQIKVDGFTFEIVPILDISSAGEAENITDISPLHAVWVLKNKKLADEVRLAKAFCRANGVYGAESYINGFSGYVLEILVAYYGSFLGLLKASQKWKQKQVIDIERHHKNVFLEVNKSKLNSPIIVIDPVQAGRNAAAALGNEKFVKFIESARSFLKSPSTGFFKAKLFSLDDLKQEFKSKNLIVVKASPKQGTDDIAGTKLLKLFEHLVKEFEKNDFKVQAKGWNWDKKSEAYFYFVFDSSPLPGEKVIEGPPAAIRFHAEKFRKAHKAVFLKGSRLFARVKRDFRLPLDLLKSVLKDGLVKEKVSSIRIVK